MESIILMGIKHCGKSAQGKLLSEKLNMPFYDIDSLITDNTGMSPRQIYNTKGEQAFKDEETKACLQLAQELSEKQKDAVIATGGGICNNEKALNALHPLGKFIFLCTQENVAADRIMREAKIGPDGIPVNLPAYIAKKNPRSIEEARIIFHSFYTERVKLYDSIADVKVLMKDAPKNVNTDQIITVI
ncbi:MULTISPECIES: shikimate kinase [Treponema]|uniref:Shikimate kinase n=1 Tax=Treponema rectale TaxID=744512 RepID=A0A840SIE6_9SPIR|nr:MULTISPECIES: shikimate kinase [Treponema]MBB5219162.1 shikimate kinase [Treponema rectale]MBE6354680.1 hypothetical protein [Treponema sp.]QOS40940.1 hypothetical protein DYE49_10980 [Treponema rectale]